MAGVAVVAPQEFASRSNPVKTKPSARLRSRS